MGDNDVSVVSAEVALVSEIEMSSAMLMKDAYLPHAGEKTDEEQQVPHSHPAPSPHDHGLTGPDARVYITKLSSRTPPEDVELILKKNPGRKTITGTFDYYTLILSISVRLSDPSTTRFINGTIDIAFLKGMKILTYSPQAKGIIAVIEKGGNAVSIHQNLEFLASAVHGTKNKPDPAKNRFVIPIGPGEKITGTYDRKSGYTLDMPSCLLLEYHGLLKNEQEMFWEIYPPMPGQDIEITGKEMQAVFSLIVQAPRNIPPTITARIDGRVKGNLWGVVPLKGSVVI
jgi:hypothetical protein